MIKKIGVLTSGGDSPGMNAAIRAVVRSALFHDIEVMGIRDGYKGLINDDMVAMSHASVSDISAKGGTILGSARLDAFKTLETQKQAVAILRRRGIDALIVIGGDGTYKGAQKLSELGMKCIGIPSTIDNDIPSTDFTIGFDTALNTIIENIDKLRDTSSSHHRCSVIEVMGNKCADLALYSGISCGAEVIITPHDPYDEADVLRKIQYFEKTKKKRHAIVIVTEKITNVHELAQKISVTSGFSGRATILGHIQRGGAPSAADRMMATKLGDHALAALLAHQDHHCVGVIDNQVQTMSLNEALALTRDNYKQLIELHERIV
ncbi:MAG: 6-phosphofructokinase [Erysipelothrix sp.]|jgi:6-phosphofructokinase 1|nr:6-phosphofructokinase [Erysipelothrix sp.]